MASQILKPDKSVSTPSPNTTVMPRACYQLPSLSSKVSLGTSRFVSDTNHADLGRSPRQRQEEVTASIKAKGWGVTNDKCHIASQISENPAMRIALSHRQLPPLSNLVSSRTSYQLQPSNMVPSSTSYQLPSTPAVVGHVASSLSKGLSNPPSMARSYIDKQWTEKPAQELEGSSCDDRSSLDKLGGYSMPTGTSSESLATRQQPSKPRTQLLSPFVPVSTYRHAFSPMDGSPLYLSTPQHGPQGPRNLQHLSQGPSAGLRLLMDNPTVVARAPPTHADNPRAAMVKMSEQVSKDQLSSDCRIYKATPPEFFRRHPFLDHVFASAVIFSHFNPPLSSENGSDASKGQDLEPRLLMLQRSAGDSGAPNCWELPGDTVKRTEESMFHSLAREIWLLTDLNITFVNRQVENGIVQTRHGKLRDGTLQLENWLHVYFEVMCLEIQHLPTPQASWNEENLYDFLNAIPVRISKSHQSWSWMTKEGVKLMLAGKVNGTFVSSAEGQKALEAFALREGQGKLLSRGRKGPNCGKRRRDAEDAMNEERYQA